MRNDEHLVGVKTFPMTLDQVEQALYDYGKKCHPIALIKRNPNDKNKGQIVLISVVSPFDAGLSAVIDFKQVGSSTEAAGYARFSMDKKSIDQIYSAISNSSNCG